jgi:hypothetical protein
MNTQNCDLSSQFGRLCRYCRFQKCQQVGMKIDIVPKASVKIFNEERRVVADLELVERKIKEIFKEVHIGG